MQSVELRSKAGMRTVRRTAIVLFLVFACVGCDQTSKIVVRANLPIGHVYNYLGGDFGVVRAENPGAFLSMGASLPRAVRDLAFDVGVGSVVCLLLLWATLAGGLTMRRRLCIAAISAAGASNLVDRIFHDGLVTDFVYIRIGLLHTGIFNFADLVLVLAVAALVLERPRVALRAT